MADDEGGPGAASGESSFDERARSNPGRHSLSRATVNAVRQTRCRSRSRSPTKPPGSADGSAQSAEPGPPAPTRVIVAVMARKPSAALTTRIESLLDAGLDAHLIVDCPVVDGDPETRGVAARVHFVPDAELLAAGFTDLQSKTCGKKLTAWERALLWGARAAAAHELDFLWVVEDDVRWDTVTSLTDLFDGYAADPADLVAQRIAESRAARPHWPHWGAMYGLLSPSAAAPLCATFNVISRLSARLLTEVAAVGAARGRLGFHEAFLPSLALQRGLRVAFYHDSHDGLAASPPPHGLPRMILRFRPPVTDAELRRREAQIYHPVKHAGVGSGGLLDA